MEGELMTHNTCDETACTDCGETTRTRGTHGMCCAGCGSPSPIGTAA